MAFRLPLWVRRALEAALIAAAVAGLSLTGGGLSASTLVALPGGSTAALLLAPSVLSLGVLPAAYPVALAATRADGLLGALAAVLLAADATVILAPGRLQLGAGGPILPAGILVSLLAAGSFVIGVAGGQLATPLGFGRRAGAWSAVTAAVGALGILAIVGALSAGPS
jgi:hypothetical protein